MTGSGCNACNGLQRVAVARSRKPPQSPAATGATPPFRGVARCAVLRHPPAGIVSTNSSSSQLPL
jgi:hypothetical protein